MPAVTQFAEGQHTELSLLRVVKVTIGQNNFFIAIYIKDLGDG
jgi:hypothetical protein